MKTRKNENSSKLREQPFVEEFSEVGVGVGCCRAGLLLSATKVGFVGAKDCEKSHLPRSFRQKCLENAFPAINFFKIFRRRARRPFACLLHPSLVWKACPCLPPNRFYPVRLCIYQHLPYFSYWRRSGVDVQVV